MKRGVLLIALILTGALFLTSCGQDLEKTKEEAVKSIEKAQGKDLTVSYKAKQDTIVDNAKKDIKEAKDVKDVNKIEKEAVEKIRKLSKVVEDAIVAEITKDVVTIKTRLTGKGGKAIKVIQETDVDITSLNASQKQILEEKLKTIEDKWKAVKGTVYKLERFNGGNGLKELITIDLGNKENYKSVQDSRLYPMTAGKEYVDLDDAKLSLTAAGFKVTDNTNK